MFTLKFIVNMESFFISYSTNRQNKNDCNRGIICICGRRTDIISSKQTINAHTSGIIQKHDLTRQCRAIYWVHRIECTIVVHSQLICTKLLLNSIEELPTVKHHSINKVFLCTRSVCGIRFECLTANLIVFVRVCV